MFDRIARNGIDLLILAIFRRFRGRREPCAENTTPVPWLDRVTREPVRGTPDAATLGGRKSSGGPSALFFAA